MEYFFFSLTMGQILKRNSWASLPIPTDVVHWVENIARYAKKGVFFANRNNATTLDETSDNNNDEDYVEMKIPPTMTTQFI